MNRLQTASLRLLLVAILAVAMLFFSLWPDSPHLLSRQKKHRPPAMAAAPLADIQEMLEEDRTILNAEFPGYVLPLEQVRLAKRLNEAIELNDATEVLRLLDVGAEVNWIGADSSLRSDTRAPLFRAIKRGNPKIVEALLKRGARAGGPTIAESIASRNQWSQTPLYFAVRCGNREIVDLLLQYGALISASNGYGKTPIVAAVENGNLAMFKHLLASGAVCDFEATFGKDRRPYPHVLFDHSDEHFIRPFDDPCHTSYSSLLELTTRSSNDGLIAAVNEQFERSPAFRPDLQAALVVQLDDADELREMIASGYDPTQYNPSRAGRINLLALAEAFDHAEVFEILLQAGAKKNGAGPRKSAVHLIVQSGSVETLERRLGQGVKLDSVETLVPGGKTTHVSPLRLAVQAQQAEMVRFLLQRPEAQSSWLNDPDLLLDALA